MAGLDVDFLKWICAGKTQLLKGTIRVQGSKNTVLPLMAASLLGTGVTVIYNCPDIEDVRSMCSLLECLQVVTRFEAHTLTIDTRHMVNAPLPYTLTGRLRSSVLLLGPLIARFGKATIGMPGGCAIGLRPVDIHLEGLMRMNVDVRMRDQMLQCDSFYLQGCEYVLHFPSVGATENLIMAAVGATGRTILRGAAREPEVIELCRFLSSMGALIEGIGTDVLIIKGSSALTATEYENTYDRIVAGTYMLAAAAIPSDFSLQGIGDIAYLKNIIAVAGELGVNVMRYRDVLKVQSYGHIPGGRFQTGIYPAFPTDLLPVLITVLTQAKEESVVTETVFENRFGIVRSLEMLGGCFRVESDTVRIAPGQMLTGGKVEAADLRQGAALVLAGMLAQGKTRIERTDYIERGYEDIVTDLQNLHAEIAYTQSARD